ncbi:MAG TPA: CDP-alcohol phosphatidyltransferase family protein [bacterium]|nr:CDP-alcohol phosphatidyltransferase family protein [bacterium]HQN74004.1 CDP-alcohol phosphatidyltransferase family protein [bacterium]
MSNPKILIPNFFTGINMLVGMLSIFYSIKGDYVNAGWLILLSTVMDKLDGTAARFFKASSSFGVEFDSYSDFVSFGIAPSILVFTYYLNAVSNVKNDFYILVACAFYIIFSAVRLAKYNISQSDDHDHFYGLTTTMSGGLLSLYMIFAINNQIEWLGWLLDVNIVAGMILFQGILLLVPFKYPKLKKPASKSGQIMMLLAFFLYVGLVLIRQLPWFIYIVGVSVVIYGTLKTRQTLSFIAVSDNDPEDGQK